MPPAGPRGAIGAAAEDAVAGHLAAAGWSILARNLRVGRDEVDILALEPGPPQTLVVVEVRCHSRARFGSPVESVDARKVARLYRAVLALQRQGAAALVPSTAARHRWRVDLVAVVLDRRRGRWLVTRHLRGLAPP
jgi:putative endonuclease